MQLNFFEHSHDTMLRNDVVRVGAARRQGCGRGRGRCSVVAPHPAPLAWMAEARYHMHGLGASLVLLAELAWLSPQRFDALSRRIADPRLERLRHKLATR